MVNTMDNLDGQVLETSLRIFDVRKLGEIRYQHHRADDAEIAVIIPLYNYKHTVIETLASVVDQDLEKLSIIVIDDCSTDGGGDEVAKFLKSQIPRFTQAMVIRHSRNQGLAMSRNSGIAWSHEHYIFMIDADNRIRRPALSRLLKAVRKSGADFAYSQTSKFGDEIGVGNADVWDPSRLCTSNYIDAMAVFRRDALVAVGGYHVSAIEQGWEDYDMWLRFAEKGLWGVFLPEMLCEYRVHSSSMLRKYTNGSADLLMAEVLLRHSKIFDLMGSEF